MSGPSFSSNDFYPFADAIGCPVELALEDWHFEVDGAVVVDIGQFKINLKIRSISTVVADDGEIAAILNCNTGNFGLYVTYHPKSKKTTVSPIDLSRLPKEGRSYFENDTVMDVGTSRAMIAASLPDLRTFSLGDLKKGWVEECSVPLSSGTTTSAQAAKPTS